MAPTDWQTIALVVTTTISVAIAGVGIVFRTWVTSSVEKRVQHRFDKQIEDVRSEHREQEERLKSELRSSEAALSTLREAVFSGRANRRGLLNQRRILAAERIWEAVVRLAPQKGAASTMSVINIANVSKRAPGEQGLQKFFEIIIKSSDPEGKLDKPPGPSLETGDTERPFVTPLVWAIFSAYRTIINNAWLHAKLLSIGIEDIEKVFNAEHVSKLVRDVLPHRSSYIDSAHPLALFHLLDEIEVLLFEAIQKMLEGEEEDKTELERAAKIIGSVSELQAENAKQGSHTAVNCSAVYG